MNTARFFAFGVGLLTLLSLALSGAGHSIASRPAASAYTLATANGFALSLSSEGRVTGLQLDGGELVSTSAPALWLRDLSDAGQVTKPNLVVNPGFEEGLAGWAQLTNGGLDVSVVVSPTHSGDASLQFASTSELPAFAAGAGDPVPVVPGQRYRISAWWRSATGYVSATDGPPSLWQMTLWRGPYRTSGLYVQWLDGDSRPLGDPQLAVPLHWNAATWRLIRRELTAPADAAFARAVVAARLQAEETLWIDDVAFVPSPEPDLAVSGSVAPCATGASAADSTCLVQTATLTNGLSLTVTYTAHVDHIAIQGEVWDLDGRERALDVSWGVPVDLTPHPRRL
ncbi:MAG TPA: hypothetical protein DEP84_02240, partial [Chloroflexi bacterium]|nr:hypothetical protein [Chloroflexota bacterium]